MFEVPDDLDDFGDGSDDGIDSDGGDVAEGWSNIWQLPALLLGLGLFVGGMYFGLPDPEGDDFPGALHSVKLKLDIGEYKEAAGMLKMLEEDIVRAPSDLQAKYEELWGDYVYLANQKSDGGSVENAALAAGYYRRAKTMGRSLDGVHRQRLAESLLQAGLGDEALEVVAKMDDVSASRRYQIIRKLIEMRLASGDAKPESVQVLVKQFLEEVGKEKSRAKRREHEIWGYTVKGQLFLDAGDEDAAIEFVERRLITLMDLGGGDDLASLDVLRAKAYLRKGEFDAARGGFNEARKKVKPADPLNADILVGLGQIELIQNDDVRVAWQLYKVAEEKYRPSDRDPANSPYLDALVGRVDCEARLGRHNEAHLHLEDAVKLLNNSKRRPADKEARLTNVALSHYVAASDVDEHTIALKYLTLLTPLRGDRIPAEWIALFAMTHERIGEKILEDAGLPVPQAVVPGGGLPKEFGKKRTAKSVDDANGGTGNVIAVGNGGSASVGANAAAVAKPSRTPKSIRLIRQEAASHFQIAGEEYEKHADSTIGVDPQSGGDSYWRAAEAYDKAYQWGRAIKMYNQFITQRSDDPRHVEAYFRLGMAYLADGQYKASVEKFAHLKKHFPNQSITSTSLVPMARALASDGLVDEAIKVLLDVVTDHPAITPESSEYRLALITLGRLYQRQGKYEPAIERLAAAVQRYGDSREGISLRFQLGESYRQSTASIDKSLREPLPVSKESEYKGERKRRLDQALILYSQVVTQLGEISETDLSPIELLYLRNASFYRADCAFDLERYEQAIELYDWASRRWKNHPSSLVALVQMVNAYAELGQVQQAKALNLKARDRLRRIPESAFDDPSLPMKRKHWQDWLKWSNQLRLFEAQASAGSSDKTPTPSP